MSPNEPLLQSLWEFLPAAGIFFGLVALILALHRYTSRRQLSADVRRTIVPQLLMVCCGALGIILTIVALPLTETTRGQMLALVGVVFTGIIALSSTTFVTNALAGLMLRLIRHYRAGDFIRINDLFGRVTERGLFHTEIQTPERNLTTLPNLYLVSHPHTVVRSSGTIISARLSLGYDLDHHRIEPLLAAAAEQADLQEVFVQVIALGDFAITYKVSGFLSDVKQLLAAQSNLRRKILDVLHQDGVEIVSPRFMNQRILDGAAQVIPEVQTSTAGPLEEEPPVPEAVIFDKAETAVRLDQLQARLADLSEKRKALAKRRDAAAKPALERIDAAIHKLEAVIASSRKALDAEDS
ncbi:MAG: mechanosensitive ion channel [Desulfosarcinaceae bacterium]|nr:mechanosensitive ion channel [Desulfosarcinaceae bacterium]